MEPRLASILGFRFLVLHTRAMRTSFRRVLPLLWACLLGGALLTPAAAQPEILPGNLWALARKRAPTHRFSTLFTAQDVKARFSDETGLREAIEWCKQTGVTKVYIEEFRDGYRAERETLLNAKRRFLSQGFLVSGCITTTRVGKPSTHNQPWGTCFTDPATQTNLQSIFEYAAGLFDEIMIDDFWCIECDCAECDHARRARHRHHRRRHLSSQRQFVGGLSLRTDDPTLAPLHAGGRQTGQSQGAPHHQIPAMVRRLPQTGLRGGPGVRRVRPIWVGTETRDYQDGHWGGTVQYEGYFIMRWLGGIGGPKCGGGWFDPLGTTERTYVEQARQTVLAGAAESVLFCYGSLRGRHRGPGRPGVPPQHPRTPFRRRRRSAPAPSPVWPPTNPPNSHPEQEDRVFDFVGMMGMPLVPCHEFPADAPGAFFSIHALKDPRSGGEAGRLHQGRQAGPAHRRPGPGARRQGHSGSRGERPRPRGQR